MCRYYPGHPQRHRSPEENLPRCLKTAKDLVDEIIIADFDFAKVGIALGFDVRFPLHFNKLVRQGCEIIALPCAWYVPQEVADNESSLKVAQEMWTSICRTRAFDNMVYLVVSNQTKDALNNLFGIGKSAIIAPTGEMISGLNLEEGGIYANIDIINESLQRYGGKKIYPEEMYWTSTESSKTEAIAIQSYYHAFVQKSESLLVVAMAEF